MVSKLVAGLMGLLFTALSAAQGVAERCPQQPWTDAVVAKAIGLTEVDLAQLKSVRALTNSEVCTMPADMLKRSILRSQQPKPDSPGDWARFRAQQQSDENGRVQPDGLIRALQVRRNILARKALTSSAEPAAGITSAGWSAIGPGNIGGRTRAIAIHASQPNTIWMGSVSGGIWKSTNAGGSWTPVNDFLGNLSVSSIVIDPNNANLMYASTGEGYFNVDAVRGAGIFKSTDAGVTWTALTATDPTGNSAWYYVNRLAIHPTNGSILLAATNNGVYRSTDAGVTWTLRTSNTQAADVRFDPLDGNKALWAPGFNGGQVAYSTDAGSTWNFGTNYGGSGSLPGRVEIGYSKQAGVVYISAAAQTNPSGSVYRSTDGGVNWTLQSTPNHLSGQGWYNNSIWVDPTNSDHVLVAGLDIYRSTNAGVSFTKISNWASEQQFGNSVHADHHAIVASPLYDGTSNRTIYFGNDGGMYKAVDIQAVAETSGWTNLNNGLAVTQFYSGAGHTGTNGQIVGGTQDNGSLRYSGVGTNWSKVFGGDGGASAIDPTDGAYVYGEYVRLQLHRATTPGGTAQYIYQGITDAGSLANFIAPFTLDPNNPNTLLAGGASVWRSTNVKVAGAPSWSAIQNSTGSNTSKIAVAPGNSNVIWVGKNNGTLFKTVDGTNTLPTWSPIGAGTLPARMVLSILVDKDNNNIVYVGFGGYSSQNLWRTTNGGTSWSSIGGGLPPAPVRAIERHPSNASFLYAGTEVGIFTSEDGGATWTTSNDGPATVSVEQLFWLNSTDLVAATHGRGMFRTTAAGAANYALTIIKSGSGSGPVTSSPSGITCGSICSANFTSGASVTLTATPNAGSVFAGWSGACAGTATTCVVTMNAAKSVTATFNPAGYTLTVTKAGTGSGPVTSSPSGITCGSICSTSFAASTVVTLTATANAGSTFAGWSGACSGTSTCVVTMNAAKSVTATFNSAGYTLTVAKAGTGSGPVTSSPSGITCGSICSTSFAASTVVTLTATPNSGSVFAGWSGACAGTATTCVVTMDAAKSVTATFNSTGYTLTVAKAGTGSGPVTSSPSGITCGSICSTSFAASTVVTLTASPNSGSVFAGWSGACSGTSTCVVTMDAAKSVTATFNTTAPSGFTLTIGKAGTGSGPVTSSPSGITCGSTCSANFTSGASVTLTATPNAGSFFAGWSGACAGTATTCVVTMNAAKSVTATFNAGYALTITKAGTGSGPVTSSPSGITCGSTCSANFATSTSVTLTATPNAGSAFAGWSGACTGMATTCVVTMDATRSVTATFNTASALGDAVDNNALTWTTLGSALWTAQTAVSFDGVDAAQSGTITDNQDTTIQTTVVGPGTLFYRWRVSSEPGFDYLTFYYDGTSQADNPSQAGAISGDSGWQQQGWSIPAGTHTVAWRYSKDVSLSENLDRGWLDQVTFSSGAIIGLPSVTTIPGPKAPAKKK